MINLFNIEAELKKLPSKPGVYIMHDKDDNIIYVGKAVSLKNRVRQYFRKNNKTARIERMVSLIDHFEYIVVDNEAEALILECNLIKKNKPKFNVLLKDDKTYPYIKITLNEEYPTIYTTRRILNDGAKYFGPYANPGSAKEMVDFIKQKFKIRQCKTFKSNKRVCLNYHIGRCLGPCVNMVSTEEYRKQIEEIIELLDGKSVKLLKKLKEEIKVAADKQEYEKAAYLRDKAIAIEDISQKQKVSNINENAIDVIGIARNDLTACIEIFFVRQSKMIGRENYFFNEINELKDEEILSQFVKQYYLTNENLPSKIMISKEIEDKNLIEEILSQKANRKVEIKHPQKGEKLKFVEMAENNAKVTLENKVNDKFNILNELKELLELENLPRKIECYDISNLSGTNIVAGMCVLKDGVIDKKLSRRFKIRTLFDQDDPACMKEVISRRLKHSINNSNGGFGKLPDVIFVDGGITQIRAAKEAIKELELNIPVYGMVKNDKHTTRALINDNRQELKLTEDLMNLITRFQDTVHDTAIEYHRKLRDKEVTKSKLDEIDGVGEVKKKELLKKFGSIDKIKNATIEELTNIKGINTNLAEKIKKKL